MKFNVQNFLRSNETKSDEIWYIKDDDPLIRKTKKSYDYTGPLYHQVKWWAYLISNGKLVLLMYIEDPSKKYDYTVYLKRRNYFCEVYESLEKGV